MLRVLWRLTRGYRLRPWRSPYLRWRVETYWGWHADQITFAQFWSFAWNRRSDLLRYLRWASRQGVEPPKNGKAPLAMG
ncbi:MAG TPA: hypothetical protein VLW65_09690 [Bryobacteraceae bacterium]|nr:hypothetical protein [Bryobacteraceae bacterium]